MTRIFEYFLLLPLGGLVGLTWANTFGESYFRFASSCDSLSTTSGWHSSSAWSPRRHSRAVMRGGALYHWRRTLLPIVAAAGGVLGAAAVYAYYGGAS